MCAKVDIMLCQVTAQEFHELTSNQEQTDTRIVLYLKYAAKLGNLVCCCVTN